MCRLIISIGSDNGRRKMVIKSMQMTQDGGKELRLAVSGEIRTDSQLRGWRCFFPPICS